MLHVEGNGVAGWHFHRGSTGKSSSEVNGTLPVRGAWGLPELQGLLWEHEGGTGPPVLWKSTHKYRH